MRANSRKIIGSNLTALKKLKMKHAVDDYPPRFSRKRYLALTSILLFGAIGISIVVDTTVENRMLKENIVELEVRHPTNNKYKVGYDLYAPLTDIDFYNEKNQRLNVASPIKDKEESIWDTSPGI